MQEKKKQQKLLFILSAIVLGMFAFGFALVPIYNSLCKSLGINGKTNTEAVVYDLSKAKIDKNREVLVQFVATNNSGVPWAFYPKVKKIKVHPGEIVRLAFYAENKTDHPMVVQAVPSVTPGIAAKYLKKTECFCFTQQTLNGHEAMNMALLFLLDPGVREKFSVVTLCCNVWKVS